MNIKLELTLDEVNIILRSLGKHPFDEIASLIVKIKQQGDAYVQEFKKSADQKPADA